MDPSSEGRRLGVIGRIPRAVAMGEVNLLEGATLRDGRGGRVEAKGGDRLPGRQISDILKNIKGVGA